MDRRQFFKAGLTGAGALAVTNKLWALQYYPAPSDKKIAVLYSTWCGSARDAAVWICEGMGGIANVFDVRENPDLTGFEQIIVGGAIRMAVTSPELQEYLNKNQAALSGKVRGVFAVCGNMKQPIGPEQITALIDNHLAKLCGVNRLPKHVFLGRITKALMDPQTAQMMASMEDYDNLKRDECLAFGKEILEIIAKG